MILPERQDHSKCGSASDWPELTFIFPWRVDKILNWKKFDNIIGLTCSRQTRSYREAENSCPINVLNIFLRRIIKPGSWQFLWTENVMKINYGCTYKTMHASKMVRHFYEFAWPVMVLWIGSKWDNENGLPKDTPGWFEQWTVPLSHQIQIYFWVAKERLKSFCAWLEFF